RFSLLEGEILSLPSGNLSYNHSTCLVQLREREAISSPNMSSLFDAVLQSETGSMLASRDRQRPDSDHPPSSRPLPSESNGPMSDAQGLPDDQVVGANASTVSRLRNPYVPGPPPVIDVAAEK